MGTDKALLPWRGQPLIASVASTMKTILDEVIIVADKPARYDLLKLQCIEDIYKQCGPLGGIHAGLTHLKPRGVFVLACDTPFVPADLIRYLIDYDSDASVVVPSLDGKTHPLCGVYTPSSLSAITNQLESGQRRVLDLLDVVPTTVVPITRDLPFFRDNILANVNTLDDYANGSRER